MRPIAAAALPLLAVAVAGCGGGSKSTSTTTTRGTANTPKAVAQGYVDALGSADYATACGLISKNTRIQVTQNGKQPCEKVFGKVMASVGSAQPFFKGAKVSAPKVKGDNGVVVVTSVKGKKTQLALVRENGVWRVSS